MAKKQNLLVRGMGLALSLMTGLSKAVERKGGSDEDLHILATPEGEGLLDQIASLIVAARKKVVEVATNIVNLATAPFIPDGWKVEEHQLGPTEAKVEKKDSQLYLDGKQVVLHFDENQQNGKVLEGNKLRKKLKGQPVLNANLMDFLLKPENQHLIPEDWKGKYIFFWGTIYRRSVGRLCVRYLCWFGDQWYWHYYWLDRDWGSDLPALVCAE